MITIRAREGGIADWKKAMIEGRSPGEELASGLPGPEQIMDTFEIKTDAVGTVIKLSKSIKDGAPFLKDRSNQYLAGPSIKLEKSGDRDMVMVLNPEGIIQFLSPSAERILGYNPEVLLEKKVSRFIHEDDLEEVKMIFNNFKIGEPPKVRPIRYRFHHKDGQWIYLESRLSFVPDSPGGAILVAKSKDITGQEKNERGSRDYNERLRMLAECVEEGRENERIRIAREIHDELGQLLTVLKFDVSMINRDMEQLVSKEALDVLEEKTGKAMDRISTIVESVQRIISELRPPVLDRLGLVEAMRWQAREFKKRTNLEIAFHSELDEINGLSDNQETTFFRIFQEAVNNVVRHAQASKVVVELFEQDQQLVLSIQDNGIGITEEQKKASNSFGIKGMYERAYSLGGNIQIGTANNSDKGTRVTVKIPSGNTKQIPKL